MKKFILGIVVGVGLMTAIGAMTDSQPHVAITADAKAAGIAWAMYGNKVYLVSWGDLSSNHALKATQMELK